MNCTPYLVYFYLEFRTSDIPLHWDYEDGHEEMDVNACIDFAQMSL
jgi:hypothetical protein